MDRMEIQGLSLREIARRMGMDASALSRVLSGERKLKLEEVAEIASILNVPVTEVIEHALPRQLRGAPRDDDQSGRNGTFKDEQADFGSASGADPETVSREKNHAPLRAGGHPLFGRTKGLCSVAPGVDLTAPVDPDWGKVYG